MKMIYLSVLVLGLSQAACTQDIPASKVPSVVVNSIQVKFPGATGIEWEKKKNNYEAAFDINSVEHNVIIDASGNLLQHKLEISNSEVPITIQQAIQSANPGYKIDEAYLIDKNGEHVYKLELESHGKKDIKVFYTSNGILISKNK